MTRGCGERPIAFDGNAAKLAKNAGKLRPRAQAPIAETMTRYVESIFDISIVSFLQGGRAQRAAATQRRQMVTSEHEFVKQLEPGNPRP